MKLPEMYYKHASFNSETAGWYVPNSTIISQILPTWREPGGGVTESELIKELDVIKGYNIAVEKAISYLKVHIETSKYQINKLQSSKYEK